MTVAASARATAPVTYTSGALAVTHDAAASPRGSPTGWLAVGFGAVGAGLAVGRALSYRLPPCVLLEGTGVPCPACGLTRLGAHVAHGEMATAAALDLPGVVLVVLLAVTATAQLLALAGRPVPWLRSAALPLLLGGLVLAHWVLTLTTGGLVR